jgi:hypothetical protein
VHLALAVKRASLTTASTWCRGILPGAVRQKRDTVEAPGSAPSSVIAFAVVLLAAEDPIDEDNVAKDDLVHICSPANSV